MDPFGIDVGAPLKRCGPAALIRDSAWRNADHPLVNPVIACSCLVLPGRVSPRLEFPEEPWMHARRLDVGD